jgi:hypothetical protein
LPATARFPETAVNTVAEDTEELQVKAPLETAHLPLLEVNVKPEPTTVDGVSGKSQYNYQYTLRKRGRESTYRWRSL